MSKEKTPEESNKMDPGKKEQPIDRERSDKESNDELSEEQLQKVAGGLRRPRRSGGDN